MCLIIFIRRRNRSAEQTRAGGIRAWLRMYLGNDDYECGHYQSPQLSAYGNSNKQIESEVASLPTGGTGSASQEDECLLVQSD